MNYCMSESEIRVINKKLDRISNLLDNDQGTGSPGVVSRLTGIEKAFNSFVAQYNMDRAVKKAKENVWATVFGFVGAAILFGIKSLVAFLFKI